MITFKRLAFSNAFSYGPNNSIDLDSSQLTQLVGKNGNGKSSIALILEEVLFNQNSKKIKKADIINRHTKDKSYFIELDFDKDGYNYTIRTNRTASTSSVVLSRNGIDISSHTATGTYKSIEHILGYDFKTFSQIVYQSSVSSLEFLVATDTARKKFLIELLNLSRYTRASEYFKELAAGMAKRVESIQTKINTVRSWLTKYEKEDLCIKELVLEPEQPTELISKVALLKNELVNINATNKKISLNNKYKEILSKIVPETFGGAIPDRDSLTKLQIELSEKQKKLKEGSSLANKCTGPTTKCPTCSKDMDNSTMFNIVKQFESIKHNLEHEITSLSTSIKKFNDTDKEYTRIANLNAEWEKYHTLIDYSIGTELLVEDSLNNEVIGLEKEIAYTNASISKIRASNKLITEHNSKVTVVSAQMADMKIELAKYSEELIGLVAELSNLQVLVKAFSTTGLVAYKIECLTKDLEDITNKYLSVLADGRFQISFKIAASDKLNVVITDNGKDINIEALSSGERARVNTATLLAIRKLMQTLSNSRTNLLILDETIENLDADGKEKLIEVLLEEESLNTILISHSFTHPLIEKLNIVKENNISRIE